MYNYTNDSCISYDENTAEVVLESERQRLLVDVSLCIEDRAVALPLRSKLLCIGTLERRVLSDTPASGPSSLQDHVTKDGTRVPTPMILHAIFFKQVDDLDLRAWIQAARTIRSAFK